MAIISLDKIKSFFERGDKPKQDEFSDTWDSFWHKLESIPMSAITGLTALISGKAETADLISEIQERESADVTLQTEIANQSRKVRGDWNASQGTYPSGAEFDPIRNGYTYRVAGLPTNEKVKFGIDLNAPMQYCFTFGNLIIGAGFNNSILHIYKSTTNGTIWQETAITAQPDAQNAYFVAINENVYYSVAEIWNASALKWDTVVSRSADGGVTWSTTLRQLPDHDSSQASLISVDVEYENLLLTYYTSDNASRIYRVYSSGSVMVPLSYIADYCAVQRIEYRQSGLHYAVIQRQSATRIYRSTDNCLNWTLLSTIAETGAQLAWFSDTGAYLVTTQSAVVRKSTDGLITWSGVSSIVSAINSNKIVSCNGESDIAVMAYPSIYRSIDSGFTWGTVTSNVGQINVFKIVYSSNILFCATGRYSWSQGFFIANSYTETYQSPYIVMQNGDYIQYSPQTDAIAQTTAADWFYYDTVNRDLRIDDFDASAIAETINETVPSQLKLPTEKAVVDAISAKISSLQGMIKLIGSWNAATNVPDISTETVAGHAYIVATAGATSLGGEMDWKLKDWAVKTAGGWTKIDNSEVPMLWGQLGGDIANQSDVMPRDLSILPNLTGDLAETNSIAVRVGTTTYNATIGKLVTLFNGLFARLDKNNVFYQQNQGGCRLVVEQRNNDYPWDWSGYAVNFNRNETTNTMMAHEVSAYNGSLDNCYATIYTRCYGSLAKRYGADWEGRFEIYSGSENSYTFPARLADGTQQQDKILRCGIDGFGRAHLQWSTDRILRQFIATASNLGQPINSYCLLAKHCATNANNPAMPTFDPYSPIFANGGYDPYVVPFNGKLDSIAVSFSSAAIPTGTVADTVFLKIIIKTLRWNGTSYDDVTRSIDFPVSTSISAVGVNNNLSTGKMYNMRMQTSHLNIYFNLGEIIGWYIDLTNTTGTYISAASRVVTSINMTQIEYAL